MNRHSILTLLISASLWFSNSAWSLGLGLGQSKEELKLDYNVEAAHHGTGRVTVNLTIHDLGALAPLSSVDLVIPSEDGTGYVDLSVALKIREEEGKYRVRVHILKTLADRAEIQLRTSHLNGKRDPLTWYYYVIPIAKFYEDAQTDTPNKTKPKPPKPPTPPAAPAVPQP